MATKNIEININNGNGYDTLYPKVDLGNATGSFPIGNTTGNLSINRTEGNLPVSRLNGPVPIEKGGTGKTSLKEALGTLCYSSPTISNLNDNYYFACADSSMNGGGASLKNIKNYIKNDLGPIDSENVVTGVRYGTGTTEYTINFGFEAAMCYIGFAEVANLGPFFISRDNFSSKIFPSFTQFILFNIVTNREEDLTFYSKGGQSSPSVGISITYVTFTTTGIKIRWDVSNNPSEKNAGEHIHNQSGLSYYWWALKK